MTERERNNGYVVLFIMHFFDIARKIRVDIPNPDLVKRAEGFQILILTGIVCAKCYCVFTIKLQQSRDKVLTAIQIKQTNHLDLKASTIIKWKTSSQRHLSASTCES